MFGVQNYKWILQVSTRIFKKLSWVHLKYKVVCGVCVYASDKIELLVRQGYILLSVISEGLAIASTCV